MHVAPAGPSCMAKKHQEDSADNCSHPLRISLAIVKNNNPQNYEKP